MRRFLKKQKGQAGLEFLLSSLVIFFFLFFYLSLAIVLVTSEYLEYATFMAARTYKSAKGANVTPGGDYGANDGEQVKRNEAREIFNIYAQRVQGVARNFNLDFVRTDPFDEQTSGVVATYDMDLFYMPPLFVTSVPISRITLSAESHLGRDPNFNDTLKFFADFVRNNSGGLPNLANPDLIAEEMDDTGF